MVVRLLEPATAAMPLPLLQRLVSSFMPSASAEPLSSRVETCPPLARRRHPAWMPRLGSERSRRQALEDARLEFCLALDDLHTARALDTKSRIAVARSLHELWHFREEVFSLVATRHDQTEAARRLDALDRHFARRPRPAATAARLAAR